MNTKIRVGITMGDPSGVGPALIAKGLPKLGSEFCFRVIGDARVLAKAAGTRGLPGRSVEIIDLQNVRMRHFAFGLLRAEYGKASIEYLDRAMDLLRDKQIDCLVTCPISKEAAKLSGFMFPGHTEYLAAAAGVRDYAMLLMNKQIKLSPVTRHIRLGAVAAQLSRQGISKNIRLVHRSLKQMFAIGRPRIVACGLNPHASDNGLMGKEENRLIRPALSRLRRQEGIRVDGPISADAAIHQAACGLYDCVIAMYHDQAMIPLKLYGNDTGVNMTLGLPYVRTSPLHGTAFDIAAKAGLIDPSSFIAAVKTAVRCAKNQKKD